MEKLELTLTASFNTYWDDETNSAKYYPEIKLGSWILWIGADDFSDHYSAIHYAESFLVEYLMDGLKRFEAV